MYIFLTFTEKQREKVREKKQRQRGNWSPEKKKNRKMLLREPATSATERNRSKIQIRTEKKGKRDADQKHVKGREYRKTLRLPTQQRLKQIRQRQ